MRTVRFGTGLAVAATLVACEPVIEPLADTVPELSAPSFAVHNPVVQSVTGGAGFYWTQPSSGEEVWRTSSLTARKYADGSVTGRYQFSDDSGNWGESRIACFTIILNEGWLGLIVEASSNPASVGSERIVYVMDNGGGSKPDPDRSTRLPPLGITGLPDLDTYCAETPEIGAPSVFDLEAGNIQILP